jgi:hypothetical protein
MLLRSFVLDNRWLLTGRLIFETVAYSAGKGMCKYLVPINLLYRGSQYMVKEPVSCEFHPNFTRCNLHSYTEAEDIKLRQYNRGIWLQASHGGVIFISAME